MTDKLRNIIAENVPVEYVSRIYAAVAPLFEAEIKAREKVEKLFNDACAVIRAPDLTNDGGPTDLAEDIRLIIYNYEVFLRDAYEEKK